MYNLDKLTVKLIICHFKTQELDNHFANEIIFDFVQLCIEEWSKKLQMGIHGHQMPVP